MAKVEKCAIRQRRTLGKKVSYLLQKSDDDVPKWYELYELADYVDEIIRYEIKNKAAPRKSKNLKQSKKAIDLDSKEVLTKLQTNDLIQKQFRSNSSFSPIKSIKSPKPAVKWSKRSSEPQHPSVTDHEQETKPKQDKDFIPTLCKTQTPIQPDPSQFNPSEPSERTITNLLFMQKLSDELIFRAFYSDRSSEILSSKVLKQTAKDSLIEFYEKNLIFQT